MPVSEKTFEQLALEDDDIQWEFVCGQVREKPPMTQEHNDAMGLLAFFLQRQLDITRYRVRANSGHTKRGTAGYFVPDVMVVPVALMEALRGTGQLEAYEDPLPFVAEVWSPSTGGYDVDTKFPEYRLRGDLEIWRLQPYEKTVTVWRRQPNGSYSETHFGSGTVPVESLPGVVIELEALFQ